MRNSTLNKFLFFTGVLFFCGIMSSSLFGQMSQVSSTVSMGAGYANDVYYSMDAGIVSETPRDNWDIAFTTRSFDFNILLNDDYASLWTYPNGTLDDWASVDTAGLSGWDLMINFDQYWEYGAFSMNAAGHPDYGWGVYNSVDHNIYGDSIFIIKLVDGTYKKLAITLQNSMTRTYDFKYADLDGNNEVEETLVAADYDAKNFIYYSIVDGEAVDREPASDSWDLIFTQWIDWEYFETLDFYQPITGVLTNYGVAAGELADFDVEGDTCFYDAAFNYDDEENPDNRLTIGGDWKYLDFATFSYKLHDSLVYFVEALDDKLYKLDFAAFSGMSSGTFEFYQTLIEALPAPTEPVVDDANNTFGWTFVEGYLDAANYYFSVDSGATWNMATANPQPIENANYDIGEVQVMLTDTLNCEISSMALLSDEAFTDGTSVEGIMAGNLFNVYPNPVENNLTIEFQTTNMVHVQLFDLVGKVVYEQQVANNKVVIPVSDYNKGVYILSLSSGDYNETHKIIRK